MNEFGYTGWGMDFLRLVEPVSTTKPEPLRPRARSIARNHGVTTTFDGREARATIHRGSEASVVTIEFEPMTRETTVAITTVLGADVGQPTEAHHRALAASGHAPSPTIAGSDCSCRARSARCLHLLALLYDVTAHVDDDPSLALSLQGYGTVEVAGEAVEVPAPRWTPLSEFDPRDFYGH